jgi:hypothetical protein
MESKATIEELQELVKWAPKYSKEASDILFKIIKLAESTNNQNALRSAKKDYVSCLVFQNKHNIALPYFVDLTNELFRDKDNDALYFDRLEVLFQYKWFIGMLPSYVDVPRSTILSLFQEMKERYLEYDEDSIKVLNYYEYLVYRGLGEIDKAEKHFKRYKELEAKCILNDCLACSAHEEADIHLRNKRFIEAVEISQPIMDKKTVCASKPQVTYTIAVLSQYFLNNLELSEKYFLEFMEVSKEECIELNNFSHVILYCVYTNKIELAKNFFSENIINALQTLDKHAAIEFLISTKVLIESLSIKDSDFHLNIPQNELLYRENGLYNMHELDTFISSRIKSICQKFDDRNGNKTLSKSVEENLNYYLNHLSALTA